MTVSVLCLYLTVAWVGLQCVIVTFPGHSHLLFDNHLYVCCIVAFMIMGLDARKSACASAKSNQRLSRPVIADGAKHEYT